MFRKIALAVIGVFALALPVATGGAAFAHGWVTNPPSRADLCATGVVDNCGQIQWEPQSVEGPGGFPAGGPPDGALCSGGNGRFSELDDPRGGNWPAQQVSSGPQEFTWNFTARHVTANWRYYITNSSYDPTQPLTRSDLDFIQREPGFFEQPPSTVTHTVNLPSRSGRHLVFAVWEIGDTANAFYSCIDVAFD